MPNIRVVLSLAGVLQLFCFASACSSGDDNSQNGSSSSASATHPGSSKADAGKTGGSNGGSSGASKPGATTTKHDDAGQDTSGTSASSGGKNTPSGSSADGGGVSVSTSGLVTYQHDIRPVLENNCIECHTAGGLGPSAFDDWPTVKKLGSAIVSAVGSGTMPPWPASSDCHPLADSRALPQETKDLFAKWQSDGFQAGDESDYVAPVKTRRRDLGTPTAVKKGKEAFTPAVNADTYRCFFAGTLEKDMFVNALDIVPGMRAEVHHVILYRVAAEDVSMIESADDQAAGGGYPCNSGGVGTFTSAQNLFSYRPGGVAVLLEENDAVYLKAGSGLVLQIHYNTQFLPAGTSPAPDQTEVRIWTVPDDKKPDRVIFRTGLLGPLNGTSDGTGGAAFAGASIPANAKTEGSTTLKMSGVSVIGPGLTTGAVQGTFIPGEIVGMTPHAHSWAKHMFANLTPVGGKQECLIDIPNWDFNWQMDYMFTTPVPYGPDDMLHLECDYDNTAEHQPTVNGMKHAVQNVTFGENTLNEMCEHYLWLRFKFSDFEAANR